LAVGYAIAAVLVLRARAGHLLDWLFLVEGILNSLTVLGTQWGLYTLTTRPVRYHWGPGRRVYEPHRHQRRDHGDPILAESGIDMADLVDATREPTTPGGNGQPGVA